MTIHDILVNCGSVNRNTYVIISCSSSGKILWEGLFNDLPIEEEYKSFYLYTIGWYFCEDTDSNQAYFQFYVRS